MIGRCSVAERRTVPRLNGCTMQTPIANPLLDAVEPDDLLCTGVRRKSAADPVPGYHRLHINPSPRRDCFDRRQLDALRTKRNRRPCMVLQIGAHTGKVQHAQGCPTSRRWGSGPHARHHQHLRRSNGACGQNHLIGSNDGYAILVHDAALDPDAAAALEDQAVNHCSVDQVQIRPSRPATDRHRPRSGGGHRRCSNPLARSPPGSHR